MSLQQIIKYTEDNITNKTWLLRMVPMIKNTPEPWNLIIKYYHTKDVSFLLDILSKKQNLNAEFSYYLNVLLGQDPILIDYFVSRKAIISIRNLDYPIVEFNEYLSKHINLIDSQTKLYINRNASLPKVNEVPKVNKVSKKTEVSEKPKEPKVNETPEKIEVPSDKSDPGELEELNSDSDSSEVDQLDYFEALFEFFKDCGSEFPNAEQLLSDSLSEEDRTNLFETSIDLLTDAQQDLLADFEELLGQSESEAEGEIEGEAEAERLDTSQE